MEGESLRLDYKQNRNDPSSEIREIVMIRGSGVITTIVGHVGIPVHDALPPITHTGAAQSTGNGASSTFHLYLNIGQIRAPPDPQQDGFSTM